LARAPPKKRRVLGKLPPQISPCGSLSWPSLGLEHETALETLEKHRLPANILVNDGARDAAPFREPFLEA